MSFWQYLKWSNVVWWMVAVVQKARRTNLAPSPRNSVYHALLASVPIGDDKFTFAAHLDKTNSRFEPYEPSFLYDRVIFD